MDNYIDNQMNKYHLFIQGKSTQTDNNVNLMLFFSKNMWLNWYQSLLDRLPKNFDIKGYYDLYELIAEFMIAFYRLRKSQKYIFMNAIISGKLNKWKFVDNKVKLISTKSKFINFDIFIHHLIDLEYLLAKPKLLIEGDELIILHPKSFISLFKKYFNLLKGMDF